MEWRGGIGKEKGNGRNRKSKFSLLYSRVLCIIKLEKKKKFRISILSLFLRMGASFLNVIYYLLSDKLFFLINLFLYGEALKRCLNALKCYSVSLF